MSVSSETSNVTTDNIQYNKNTAPVTRISTLELFHDFYKSPLSMFSVTAEQDVMPSATTKYPIDTGETFVQAQLKETVKKRFKPRYGTEFKKVLYDALSNDEIISSMLDIMSFAVAGIQREMRIVPIIGKDKYNDDEELQQELTRVGLTKSLSQELMDYIKLVEYDIDFDYWIEKTVRDALLGGRSALLMEYLLKKDDIKPKGTPALFKPLAWASMGQNIINENTWRIEKVEYDEFEKENDKHEIPINDMIYLAHDDGHDIPNKLTYGKSIIHPAIKYSLFLRQATERDIPEIVTTFWCSPGILEIPNFNGDTKKLIADILQPGGLLILKQQGITFTPLNLKHDGWFLIQMVDLARKQILRAGKFPPFLLDYDASSRNVVEASVNTWRDFVVVPKQKWLENCLNKQWYSRLIRIFLSSKGKKDVANKLKIEMRFKKFSIEDLLAKANSIELLLRRNVISIRESRGMVNLDEKRLEDILKDYELSPEMVRELKFLFESEQIKSQIQQAQLAETGHLNSPIGGSKTKPPFTPPNFGNESQNTQNKFSKTQASIADKKQFGRKTPSTRKNARPLAKVGAGRSNKV